MTAQAQAQAPEARATSIAFSGKQFRQALGSFATGVTVVTTMGENGEAYGMTVNAFSSVSLDPPLVLVCAISGNAGSEQIDRNKCFAVNILALDQEPISNYFAKRDRPRGRDAFRDVDHRLGVTGAPLLDGVVAHLDCRLHSSYTVGDHEVFIGEVMDLFVNPEAEPLLFAQGGYRFLHPKPAE
jgi:flavin reductase (DIM6/NTAB) family NADH-FMN oxidoreductase RutF